MGVIQGQLTVGLSDDEIVSLGSTREKNDRAVIKISRRDLPIALSQVSSERMFIRIVLVQ